MSSRINLGMIVAMTQHSGIGMNGTIPWCHREDLARFRKITMGCPMIMGRKTWDSLPMKPLPGRVHIVLTRDPAFVVSHEMVRVVHSREDALRAAEDTVMADTNTSRNPDGWVWIIGGEEIFKLFSQHRYLRKIEITRVPDDVSCDTFFPHFPLWFQKTHTETSKQKKGIVYVTYESRGPDDEIVRHRSFT